MAVKFKLALLLACAMLTACVTPTKYAATNPGSNEKLRAAQISYQLGPPRTISAYVMKNGPEREKNILIQQINEDTRLLTVALANRVPKQLGAAFRSRGVRGGTEETVSIKPLSARGSSKRNDIALVLEISVKTSDRSKPLWIAEISESSVPDDPSGEKISANVTERILAELTKAGFIAAP